MIWIINKNTYSYYKSQIKFKCNFRLRKSHENRKKTNRLISVSLFSIFTDTTCKANSLLLINTFIYFSILLHRTVVLASPSNVHVNNVKSQSPESISSTCNSSSSSFFSTEKSKILPFISLN